MMAEWQRARLWILDTGVSFNNRKPEEHLVDFAECLRDGTVLCEILNIMKPECVDYDPYIGVAENDEFSCKRNITSFLKTCAETFHIKEDHLFSVSDLYELMDLNRVWLTLSALSKTNEAAEAKLWIPFNAQLSDDEDINEGTDLRARITPSSEMAGKDEDIYKQVERLCSSELYNFLIRSSYVAQEVSIENCAYEDSDVEEIVIAEYIEELRSDFPFPPDYDLQHDERSTVEDITPLGTGLSAEETTMDCISAHVREKIRQLNSFFSSLWLIGHRVALTLRRHCSCKMNIEGPTPDHLEEHNTVENINFVEKLPPCKPPKTIRTKRENIMEELIQNEESYLNQLKILVEIYIPTLKTYMTEERRDRIFLNLEEIYLLHQSIYGAFKTETYISDNASDQGLYQIILHHTVIDFSIFTRFKTRFLVYAYYCSHLEQSKLEIEVFSKKSPEFRDAVAALNRKQNSRLPSLSDYLAICFQHVLRYQLILRRLKETTDIHHRDWSDIDKAVTDMRDVADYIDSYKGDTHIISKMRKIEKTLQFPEVVHKPEHFGRLVHNGEIEVQFHQDGRWKNRFAFLFDRVLLLSKPKGDMNRVKEIVHLNNYVLGKVQSTAHTDKHDKCFVLVAKDEDEQMDRPSCMIYTRNIASWMKSFDKCRYMVDEMVLVCENVEHTHVMKLKTFDEKDCEPCGVCGLLLLGLIDQGYLCEGCQLRVHESCLKLSYKYLGSG